MTEMSKAIYLAELLGNAGTILSFGWIGCWICSVALFVAGAASSDINEDKTIFKRCSRKATKLVIAGFVFAGVCMFVPGQKAMYAIIALEAANKTGMDTQVLEFLRKKLDTK